MGFHAPAGSKGCVGWPILHEPSAQRVAAAVSAPAHIMIVEDHEQVRRFMARALRGAGFTVSEAGGAEDARVLLAERHFALVILDVSLPGAFGGIQLGKWMRLRNPDMKLIFITGLSDWELPEQMPRDAVTRFLRKPFGARVIVDFVFSLLSPHYEDGNFPGAA